MEEAPLSAAVRSRLDTQGYVDVDDATLSAVAPWVRWSPSICTSIVVLGTALASEWVLWRSCLRRDRGADAPPPVRLHIQSRPSASNWHAAAPGAQRAAAVRLRHGCGLDHRDSVAFAAGAPAAGYALGGMLAAVGALVSVTHFCVPSTIYGILFGKPAACRSESA